MRRLLQIVVHSITIFQKRHLSFSQKIALFSAYLRISFKRFLLKFNITNSTKIKFLGYEMQVTRFKDFFWTFLEVFIAEDYYFETKNEKPYVIDCGGNLGIATLYFKWLYPGAIIDIFEMEPTNIALLQQNIKINKLDDITIHQKAVSKTSGVMTLYGDRRAGTIHKNLINEQVKKDSTYSETKVEVETVRLSEYIHKHVDFLKMDIEGAESDVFEDLRDSGKMEEIEKVTLEFHRFSSNENRLSTIMDVLEKFDFDTVFLSRFTKIEDIKRPYYNYMVRAAKRHW